MRRLITYIVLAIGCFWGGMSLYISLKPKITSYARTQIRTLSTKYTPFTIDVQDVSVSFFSPALRLTGIRVLSSDKELESTLQEITIEEVRAQLDLFRLLGGQLYLSALVLEGIDGRVIQPQKISIESPAGQSNQSQNLNWSELFENLRSLPMRSLVATDIDLDIEYLETRVSIVDLDIIFDKYYDEIQIKSFGPQINFFSGPEQEPFRLSEEIHASLNKEEFQLHNFHLRFHDSYLKANGEGKGLTQGLDGISAELALDSSLEASHITEILNLLRPNTDPVSLVGQLDFGGNIAVSSGQQLSGNGTLSTKGFKIDGYELGNITAQGKYDNDSLVVDSLRILHSAGQAKIEGLTITSTPRLRLIGTAQVEKLDLQKLFVSLGLKGIPVDLSLKGVLPCEAEFEPLLIQCNGTVEAEALRVKAEQKAAENIVALDEFIAKGSLQVDSKKVSYKAEVEMPQSQGGSEGTVIYDEGFDISYFGDRVDFADVAELANLKFEGSAKVKGRTWGDSQYGRIELELSTSDFWFEDYGIGQAKAKVTYKDGELALRDLSGNTGVSRYQGEIAIDLIQSEINTEFIFPYLESSDVTQSLARKTTLPFSVTGSGTAAFSAQGPLDISKLSYKLDTKIFKGQIAGENFDRFQAQVLSDGGHVQTRRAFLEKGQGRITVEAKANPQGEVDAVVVGSKLMLDEFNAVAQLSAPVAGELDFRAAIRGPISKPEINLKGSLEAFSIAGRELASSLFQLDIEEEAIRGSANLIGNRVKSNFQIPVKKGVPLIVNVDTEEWDFSTLLSLLGGEGLHKEYESALSSKVRLTSTSGDLWQSTGSIEISKFDLARQHFGVTNQGPIEITMNNGQFFISNFRMQGPESSLEISGKNFSRNNLSISVNGHTDLRLLHIFVPFLEDISGPASLSIRVGGRIDQPEMLGSAFLDRVFVKLPGFPHPLERIRSDILFSQRRVLINTIKGQMAGGVINGDGTILLDGVKKFPMNINILVEGATLQIPDGVKSNGIANLKITGDWFPFLISGDYVVSNALINMEFAGSAEVSQGPKRSIYLPDDVSSNSFEPIAFNINVLLDKNIQIKNALIKGYLSGKMLLTGTPTSPGITGEIKAVTGTEVLFRDQVFEVSNAIVNFDNPDQLNPELFLAASSRVQEWDINLMVQGRANDPQIRLTSQPPLSEEDIISLLALGIVSSSQAAVQLDPEQQQLNSQYQIGSAIYNQSSLNKGLQERLGVELILSSSLEDTRVVPTATVSRKLTTDVTASYTRNLDQGGGETAKLRYQMDDNVAAIGSFQGAETGQEGDANESIQTESILGLDLEYRVEFK